MHGRHLEKDRIPQRLWTPRENSDSEIRGAKIIAYNNQNRIIRDSRI
jgi:hypothetical protein